MKERAIEFLGTCGVAWMTVAAIRFAADFADSAWWLAWVALACVTGLATVLCVAEWVVRMAAESAAER